jgi:hypothetical protein
MSKLLESLGLKQPDVKGRETFARQAASEPMFLCPAKCLSIVVSARALLTAQRALQLDGEGHKRCAWKVA